MNKNALPMFTRRSLMLTSAMLAGGAALGGLSRGAAAQAKDMDMWYWGEQELPGLQKYVNDSVAKYTAANVKPMLQDTAVVISQFQTAAAAGNAPAARASRAKRAGAVQEPAGSRASIRSIIASIRAIRARYGAGVARSTPARRTSS